jgi:Sodium/calcium exchanger protein
MPLSITPRSETFCLWPVNQLNVCLFNADTFASKVAAVQDKYADASVGNVTGSNAVNVFLGIGIAWSIAAIYKAYHGEVFYVPPGR